MEKLMKFGIIVGNITDKALYEAIKEAVMEKEREQHQESNERR
jgi:hypothetical protein